MSKHKRKDVQKFKACDHCGDPVERKRWLSVTIKCEECGDKCCPNCMVQDKCVDCTDYKRHFYRDWFDFNWSEVEAMKC